jgi:hypothetical protein
VADFAVAMGEQYNFSTAIIETMKPLRKSLLWILIAAAIIVPIVYFVAHWSDQSFRDSALGNWFATVLGVIVGIPIALEINRRQQLAQDNRMSKDRENEELTRKNKILTLVKKELEFNLDILGNRQSQKASVTQFEITLNGSDVAVNGLKDELWNSFSDGGELQWIKDLDLLDAISTAYHQIRIMMRLEGRYLKALDFSSSSAHTSHLARENIQKDLNKMYTEVSDVIGKAIDAIAT